MYKRILLILSFYLCTQLTFAQILPKAISIKPQLNQIINDFANEFSSVKGERVDGELNTVQYQSKVQPNAAIETKIIGYLSKQKTYWVWESKLFVTEDIDQLKRNYKILFQDIAGYDVGISNGEKLLSTTGYTAPSEELRLWIQQFKIINPVGIYENLVVDLIAEYINFEWVITIRLYDVHRTEEAEEIIQ